MDLYSEFCNICYKPNDGSLKDLSDENMKYLKDTLFTFVGHEDIINHNIINLCQLCCEALTHSNKFREKCYTNFIQLRQMVIHMKSKLEFEDEACAVQNTLQIFVQQEVLRRSTLEKSNCPSVSTPVEYETVKRSADLRKNNSVINLQSERNECRFVGERSGVSESQGFAFVKCERESYEDYEYTKEEFGGQDNINVEGSGVNNSERIVNSGTEYMKGQLHVKQEKSGSEDEFGDGRNVPFDAANLCTIVNMEQCEGNTKDDMKLPNDESTTAINNTQTSHPHVRDYRDGRGPPTQQSGAPKRVYPGSELHTCAVCNKSFKTSNCLTVHERTHSGEKPYKCTICEKAFTQSSHLTKHTRTHSGDRPYKCLVCNKAFTQSSNLTKHERTHSGDRPYKCTVCTKGFTQFSHLIVHERRHRGDKPYECTICNKTFSDSSHLIRHERTHSGERPYECTVCKKAFIDSSGLTTHERIHSGDRPYKCSVCNKAFTQSSALTTHERIHTGDRPYKCPVCNKAFTDSSALVKHKRLHNNDRPQ